MQFDHIVGGVEKKTRKLMGESDVLKAMHLDRVKP